MPIGLHNGFKITQQARKDKVTAESAFANPQIVRTATMSDWEIIPHNPHAISTILCIGM